MLMRARIPAISLVLGLCLAFGPTSFAEPQASVQTFTDEASFLAATGAVDNGPVPNDGQVNGPPATHVWGFLTFSISAPATALHFGTMNTSIPDWTGFIAGHDIAISGVESLNVDLSEARYAIGFQLAEPTTGVGCTAGCVTSLFDVRLIAGTSLVAQLSFDIPDDVGAFYGVWSDTLFDRVEFRDTSDNVDDEYWGRCFIGATGLPSVAQALCFGDGSTATACPCGNFGAAGAGCNNSAGNGGAILSTSGTPSLSNDTLSFTQVNELGSALSIFLQGTLNLPNGIVFGDGVRCVGGSLKRLYVKAASAGMVQAPIIGTDPSVSSISALLGDTITAGATRYYGVYYRDASATFCPNPPGNTWNIGNGYSITWQN
jgi:hypothetical protein